MEKKRILVVGLIGLLLAVGLFLAGCEGECPGSGDCTITIGQNAYGLYVDTSAPRSSCGSIKNNNSNGCQVANMNSIYWQNETMKYGKHSCNCKGSF